MMNNTEDISTFRVTAFVEELEQLLRKYKATIQIYNGGEASIEYCDWSKESEWPFYKQYGMIDTHGYIQFPPRYKTPLEIEIEERWKDRV